MKQFIKFFAYGIVFSGILLFLTFLLDFAPLDTVNGSIFSNALVTGLMLFGWGANRIRANQGDRQSSTDILYGAKRNDSAKELGEHERMTQSNIPSALGLFLAGVINIALSYFF